MKKIIETLTEEMMGSESCNVMDLIQLTQSPLSIYQHKLLYLTLSLVLPSHPDLSLLIINSLSKDLQSDSVFIISTALSTLGHVATETMADSLFTRVQALLKHQRYALFLILSNKSLCAQESTRSIWSLYYYYPFTLAIL